MTARRSLPYRVEDSDDDLVVLLRQVNSSVHRTYGPDLRENPDRLCASPLREYANLLDRLRRIPMVQFRTMAAFMREGAPADRVTVVIRHDIDADLVAALRLAELEAERGIGATHYVLHTAAYYGRFVDGVFRRNAAMAWCYRRIAALGHEVGLHIDPLHVYQEHGVDGAEAMTRELEWLRGLGLQIVGAAAHNHTSVYGAQNYEIFRERLRNHCMPGGNDAEIIDVPEVIHDGKWAPLHVVGLADLGLEYEAHDTYAVPGYLGIMAETGNGRIHQTWNRRRDPAARGLRSGPGDFDDLDGALDRVRPGEAVIFTTHPCYYGARTSEFAAPTMRPAVGAGDPQGVRKASSAAVPGRARASLVVHDRRLDTGMPTESIVVTNGLGLADAPLSSTGCVDVVLVGGAWLASPSLMVFDQPSAVVERTMRAAAMQGAVVRTLVVGAGTSDLEDAIRRLLANARGGAICIGLDPGTPDDVLAGLRTATADAGPRAPAFIFFMRPAAGTPEDRGRIERILGAPVTGLENAIGGDCLLASGALSRRGARFLGDALAATLLARDLTAGSIDLRAFEVPAAPVPEPAVTVICLRSISYTGTTWINTVLASHPEALLVGPPERFLDLWQGDPGRLCLLHGSACDLWPAFAARFDPAENFFVQLAGHTGKRWIVINNPSPARLGAHLDDPRVRPREIRVVRDGRAVVASYMRKFKVPATAAIDWFEPAARAMPWRTGDPDALDLRYEDMLQQPIAELDRVGAFVGLRYSEASLRYGEWPHHPISGNQGMYALLRLHQGLPTQAFAGADFYAAQYAEGRDGIRLPMLDMRWQSELSAEDLAVFERRCGRRNRSWGYGPRERADDRLHAIVEDSVDRVRAMRTRIATFILESGRRSRVCHRLAKTAPGSCMKRALQRLTR
ncbi:MAG: hypothetical protein KF817_10485 [Phycisphaeraceae bacterium]|nr:hypothetical protein [Phycisphaeraceae bacterium]